jgi:hypothetical protein
METTTKDLDLRDWFAGMALQGLLANYEIVKSEERKCKKYGTEYQPDKPNWFPDSAYAFADEMMKARTRHENK